MLFNIKKESNKPNIWKVSIITACTIAFPNSSGRLAMRPTPAAAALP